MTCPRAQSQEKFCAIEHTKPLSNEHGIFCLRNLYQYFSFHEILKICKYKSLFAIHKLLTITSNFSKLTLILPNVRLDKTKQSFVFSVSKNWNELYMMVMSRSGPNEYGIVVLGFTTNSDFSASTLYIK